MEVVSKWIPFVLERIMPGISSARRIRRREVNWGDRLFYYGLKASAWALGALLLSMIFLIWKMSVPAFHQFGWRFFITNDWNSVTGEFGALALIYGTVVSSLAAIALAVPVSVAVALFLNELAPEWLSRPLGFFIEMLAAIPSIVYGLWGLFVLAPFLRNYIQPPWRIIWGLLHFFRTTHGSRNDGCGSNFGHHDHADDYSYLSRGL
ncbi:MAG: hypothetical protein IPK68_02480 [Bdellovibrionales bacterium]|nr:hypothetical protein [Bdellovibrionales bacterium]